MKPAWFLLPVLIVCSLSFAYAGDGVDNNYVDDDANRLSVNIDGTQYAVLFGPGSYGSYTPGIYIPNGTIHNFGPININFNITGAFCSMRSAYNDRVETTTLYWRVYPVTNPPAYPQNEANPAYFTGVPLTHPAFPWNGCITFSRGDNWENLNVGVNVLNGLPQGQEYILEFFHLATLVDIGTESGTCISVNPTLLCELTEDHNRQLKSTYNTTDPNYCNYPNVVAGQSLATRIRFTSNVALPLSWTAFSAKRLEADVALQWKTEQEFNLDRFVVERHRDGDGWQPVGSVTAYNSAVPNTYTYTDAGAPQDNLYYRLRAEDFDGTYEYSIVVSLAAAKGAHLRVLPNPAGSFADLLLEEGAHVQIFDAYGHTLYNNPEADGNVRIETFDWPSGMYSVWVLGASGAVLERSTLLVEH